MRHLFYSFAIAAALSTASFGDTKGGGAVSATASAKVSIKADVAASAQAKAAAGDAAYAAGNFEAALAAYGEGFAQSRDAAFIYAQAQCHKAMGHKDDAKVMFEMYLSAKGTLKYKADVEAELTGKAKSTVGSIAGKVKDTTLKVADVGAGVFGAVKLGISGSVSAAASASAKAGDTAYAAGKYGDAAKSYLEAYAQSQQTVALYAAAQAKAQAGAGAEARGMLLGYLAAEPSGKYAKDARTLLLAVGGQASAATKISVKAKVAADVKAQAEAGDKAMAAGKYLDAAKAYGEAHAKKADASLLYAKAIAQLYAGQTADAVSGLKAYLAAGGNLEFKVSAEAYLRASGAA